MLWLLIDLISYRPACLYNSGLWTLNCFQNLWEVSSLLRIFDSIKISNIIILARDSYISQLSKQTKMNNCPYWLNFDTKNIWLFPILNCDTWQKLFCLGTENFFLFFLSFCFKQLTPSKSSLFWLSKAVIFAFLNRSSLLIA